MRYYNFCLNMSLYDALVVFRKRVKRKKNNSGEYWYQKTMMRISLEYVTYRSQGKTAWRSTWAYNMFANDFNTNTPVIWDPITPIMTSLECLETRCSRVRHHVHTQQVSRHPSCDGTYGIWLWINGSNIHFIKSRCPLCEWYTNEVLSTPAMISPLLSRWTYATSTAFN